MTLITNFQLCAQLLSSMHGQLPLNVCERFTFDNKSSYELSIYVDTPKNSEKSIVAIGLTGIDAGHAFFGLRQIREDDTVECVLGFYPERRVLLFALKNNVPSALRNDAGREYNFRVTIDLDGCEFQQVLDQVLQSTNSEFNVYRFNCVDFCHSLLGRINIHLPLENTTVFFDTLHTPVDLCIQLRNYHYASNGKININSYTP